MELDQLAAQLQNITIQNITHKTLSSYNYNKTIDSRSAYHITKITVDFIQLWKLFNDYPVARTSKYLSNSCIFEYKITKGTDLFTIYTWCTVENLQNTKEWNIGTTSMDSVSIQDFLECLFVELSKVN
jgi:hypothetical protein